MPDYSDDAGLLLIITATAPMAMTGSHATIDGQCRYKAPLMSAASA